MRHSPGCKCSDCNKVSKASVHYRLGAPHRKCGGCTMYCKPSSCTLVEGHIRVEDLCDKFRKKS